MDFDMNKYHYIPEEQQGQEQNGVENSTPYKKYSSFSAVDCENYTPPEWLIKGYVEKNTLNMIFGEPKNGKTNVILDIGWHIATPILDAWHNTENEIAHGHVIYFAGEGVHGVKKRLRAWQNKYGVKADEMNFTVIDEAFQLDADDDTHSLDATIWNIKQICENPALIIFDTLNRYMAGDENSTKDMTRMTDTFTKIQKATGATVFVVHHSGHSEKGRARGSSVLAGNYDNMFNVTKHQDHQCMLTHVFSKDQATHKPTVFNIETTELPGIHFKNGDPVTSCTIEINDEATTLAAEKTTKGKAKKTPINEKRGKESYSNVAKKSGEILKDEKTQEEFIAIDGEEWRKEFYKVAEALDTPAAKRSAFNDARKKLCEEQKYIFTREISGNIYYCLATNDALGAVLKSEIEASIAERHERTAELFKEE